MAQAALMAHRGEESGLIGGRPIVEIGLVDARYATVETEATGGREPDPASPADAGGA